jgi:hypothetical protein
MQAVHISTKAPQCGAFFVSEIFDDYIGVGFCLIVITSAPENRKLH